MPTESNPTTDPAALLDQIQAAHRLGLKNPKTLSVWRSRRTGPPYRKVGKRLVRYALADLEAWMQRVEG